MMLSRQLQCDETIFWSEIILLEELRAVALEFADCIPRRDLQDVSHGVLVQDYLAGVHVSQHKVEHLVVLAVLNLYDLLHRLVNLEHRVESAGAGGQHTSVGWEVPPTYLKKILVSFATLKR